MKRNNLYHAVVVSIEDDYIIVLDQEGTFHRLIFKEGLTVGEQIYFFDTDIYSKSAKVEHVQFKPIIRTLLIAAMVFLFVGVGSQYFNNSNDVYAAVSFGTQTGVQVELNKHQEIIQLTTPEGEPVQEDWIGRNINEATPDLLSYYSDEKSIKDTLIGLSSNNLEWIRTYEDFIVKVASETNNVSNMIVIKGDLEDYKQAQENQILLADYQLASSQINFWEIMSNNVLSTQEKQQLLGNEGDYYEFESHRIIDRLIDLLRQENVPEAFRAVLNTIYQVNNSIIADQSPQNFSNDNIYDDSDDDELNTIPAIISDDDRNDDWDDDDWDGNIDNDWDDDDWDDDDWDGNIDNDWDDDDWDDDDWDEVDDD